MKSCRLCGEAKPLDDFPPRSNSADGRRTDCKECNYANNRAYALANKERLAAYRRQKYERNREKVIQERREFRAKEAERINAARRARHAADPERTRRLTRERYKRNPNLISERVRKQRFRRRNVKIEALVERDGLICGICGGVLFPEKADIDHIVPQSRGGSNAFENLQLAHIFCNRSKNNRLPIAD